MSGTRRLQHAAATLAVVLQLTLIVFGVVRTETVVQANHLFPFADKVWHLVWYGGIAGLLWVALGRRGLAALAVVVAFGVLDEGVQAFTPGRSAELADLSVDILAGCIVVGALGFMRPHASRRPAREPT